MLAALAMTLLAVSSPMRSESLEKLNTETSMDLNQLLDAQKQIIDLLKVQESKLIKIRDSDAPLVARWQEFIGIILPIQMTVAKKLGFGSDHSALTKFNQLYMKEAAHHLSLRELNEQKWLYLLEKAFGLKVLPRISVEEARDLVGDICDAMTQEEFLVKVDGIAAIESSVLEKRQQLLTILFPLHMSVMAKHGFKGEEGYIQAQSALIDHYQDPEILKKVDHAQMIVFRRAKLI